MVHSDPPFFVTDSLVSVQLGVFSLTLNPSSANNSAIAIALDDGKAAIRISGLGGAYPGTRIGTTSIRLVYASTAASSAQNVSLTNDTTVAISFIDGVAAVGVHTLGGGYAGVTIGTTGPGLVSSTRPNVSLAKDTTVTISFDDGVTAVDVLVFAGGYPGTTIGTTGPGLPLIRMCRVD